MTPAHTRPPGPRAPGDGLEVLLVGVLYAEDTGELEIYLRDEPRWSGIPMSRESAARVYRAIDEHGAFFHEDVRYVVRGCPRSSGR